MLDVPPCVEQSLGTERRKHGGLLGGKVFVVVTEEGKGRLECQGWSTLRKGAKVDMKPSSLVLAVHSEAWASQTPQHVREDGFCAPC